MEICVVSETYWIAFKINSFCWSVVDWQCCSVAFVSALQPSDWIIRVYALSFFLFFSIIFYHGMWSSFLCYAVGPCPWSSLCSSLPLVTVHGSRLPCVDFKVSQECIWGFRGGSAGEESACNARDPSSIPGLGKICWRRDRLPTPVFWPGESHAMGL